MQSITVSHAVIRVCFASHFSHSREHFLALSEPGSYGSHSHSHIAIGRNRTRELDRECGLQGGRPVVHKQKPRFTPLDNHRTGIRILIVQYLMDVSILALDQRSTSKQVYARIASDRPHPIKYSHEYWQLLAKHKFVCAQITELFYLLIWVRQS